MSIAGDVKRKIDAARLGDSGIHFVLQPVLRNLLLHHPYVPCEARAKVSATAGKTESTFGPACAENTIGSADRSAFAKGNDVVAFLHWFCLRFVSRRTGFRLGFGVFVRNG